MSNVVKACRLGTVPQKPIFANYLCAERTGSPRLAIHELAGSPLSFRTQRSLPARQSAAGSRFGDGARRVAGGISGGHPAPPPHRCLHRSPPCFPSQLHRLGPPFRRFGGVLIDIFYDHILARDWESFAAMPLPEFAADVYASFETQWVHVPAEARLRLEAMRRPTGSAPIARSQPSPKPSRASAAACAAPPTSRRPSPSWCASTKRFARTSRILSPVDRARHPGPCGERRCTSATTRRDACELLR